MPKHKSVGSKNTPAENENAPHVEAKILLPQLVDIKIPYAQISKDKPLRLWFTLEKAPTEFKEGDVIAGSVRVDIDVHDPKKWGGYSKRVQKVLKDARELNSIDEKLRPRSILGMLSSNNIGWHDDKNDNIVNLSDIIDRGYGVCRHLSAVTLVLAKVAGMEGALMTNFGKELFDETAAINIVKPDGKKLFIAEPLGEIKGRHAWVELKVGKDWVPIDPTTRVVGDSKVDEKIFVDARYRSVVTYLYQLGLPPGLQVRVPLIPKGNMYFEPKEKAHTGIIEIWAPSSTYEGPLNFRIGFADRPNITGLYQVSVKVLSVDTKPIED